MTEKPGRGASFRPKEGILDSLGMTEDEFNQAVFDAYVHHKKRDCRASIHVLPVTLKGRLYLLEEVAKIKHWAETVRSCLGSLSTRQARRVSSGISDYEHSSRHLRFTRRRSGQIRQHA